MSAAFYLATVALMVAAGYRVHRLCVLEAADSLEPLIRQDEWDQHVEQAVALTRDEYSWLDNLSMSEIEMAGSVLADIDLLTWGRP